MNWTSGKGVDQLRFSQVFECCLANHNMYADSRDAAKIVHATPWLATDTRSLAPETACTGGGLNTLSGL